MILRRFRQVVVSDAAGEGQAGGVAEFEVADERDAVQRLTCIPLGPADPSGTVNSTVPSLRKTVAVPGGAEVTLILVLSTAPDCAT